MERMSGTTKQIWYTSDLHFYHEKVANLRGFGNSPHHDSTIMSNWIEQVNPQDDVYILGDIASDARTTANALSLIDSLPGNKIIIAGNHDPFHPKNRDWMNWYARIQNGYMSIHAVAPFARRKLAGQTVMLSHFPYYRERGTEEPRDMQYRLRNEGNWLLHGHTHTKEIVTVEDSIGPVTDWRNERFIIEYPHLYTREIHVGLDAHDFKLVNQEQVLDIIKG
jgi:calcineurin-like phosphoesterase family protein